MYIRLNHAQRAVSVVLGIITLASVVVLPMWDVFPSLFPARAHVLLAAIPLTMIAIAYLVYNTAHLPGPLELIKVIMLAAAFLFWAANQFWPDSPWAVLFNDIAMALFVLDVFLVIIGWPATSPHESFAETYVTPENWIDELDSSRRILGRYEGAGT
jgi:hypothetical protein